MYYALHIVFRCLLKGEPIHLSVTKRPSPEKDMAYSFSVSWLYQGTKGSAPTWSKTFSILPHLQWLTVDPQTSCPLLHSDVSANCPIFRTGSESAWENDEQFRYLCRQYSHKIKDYTQVVITYSWCTLFSSPPSSFQLQTVDNLQTEKTKQNVIVSASLCHGTDSLPDSVSPESGKVLIKGRYM